MMYIMIYAGDHTSMEVFQVGGSVRDMLLGKPCKDIDFVVVGSTPQEMEDLGYRQVGADFPVFLDTNGVEYALARIERKTGSGYHGFECDFNSDVTLEEDLIRRDLTINSMARRVVEFEHHADPKTFIYDEEIVDPYGGQQDLASRTIRHTSEAFSEDPVRVLRAARFAARYHFSVAEDTKQLMRNMVQSGELNHLVNERVWTEVEKALSAPWAHLFFDTLKDVGADRAIFCRELTHRAIHNFRLAHSLNLHPTVQLISLEYGEDTWSKCGAPKEIRTALRSFQTTIKGWNETDDTSVVGAFLHMCKSFDVIRRKKHHQIVSDLVAMQIATTDPVNQIDQTYGAWMNCNRGLIESMCEIKFNTCSAEERSSTPKNKINDLLWEKRKQLCQQVIGA